MPGITPPYAWDGPDAAVEEFGMAPRKPRVLYLLQEYPQISETYIANELEAMWDNCDIRIVTRLRANLPYRDHRPFTHITAGDSKALASFAAEFRPDIVHAHYLTNAVAAGGLARQLGAAFTLRLHSFDVLAPHPATLSRAVAAINSPECLGVLTFPFTIDRLVAAGITRDRLHASPPVLRLDRFLDRGPNGVAIMNTGAALPKKNMEAFVDLAATMPGRCFQLYAMGYRVADLAAYNQARGAAVVLMPPVEPIDMPVEYKKHEWLVYTASPTVNTVGWPMAIAEAQASGVGVLMQEIRPDLATYVGKSGYLFRTLEEARAILAQPFSAARRERGFEDAMRWSLERHIGRLTALWTAGLARQGKLHRHPEPGRSGTVPGEAGPA